MPKVSKVHDAKRSANFRVISIVKPPEVEKCGSKMTRLLNEVKPSLDAFARTFEIAAAPPL